MKVFISLPMGGRTQSEVMRDIDRLKHSVSTYYPDAEFLHGFMAEEGANPLEFLGEAIKILSQADAVVFSPGYYAARGCRIEHRCCEYYGIPVIDLSTGIMMKLSTDRKAWR
jgi:hypothetical protein